MRKLTKDEITEISHKIKYQDKIDFDDLRKFILKWFPSAAKAICSFSSQYNDETYDQVLDNVMAFDSEGRELPSPPNDNDEYYDDKYKFEKSGGFEGEDDWGDVVVFTEETKLKLEDLYTS